MADNSSPMANVNDALLNFTMGAEEAEASSYEMFMLNLAKKENEQIASASRLSAAEKLLLEGKYKDEIDKIKSTSATAEEEAQRLGALKKSIAADTVELARKMEENLYRIGTKQDKLKMKNEQSQIVANTKLAIKEKMREVANSNMHGNKKNAELKKLRKQEVAANHEQIKLEKQKRALTVAALKEKRKDGVITKKELHEQFDLISESYEAERQAHEDNIDFINEQIEALKKKKEEGGLQDGGTIDQEIQDLEKQKDEEKAAAKEADKGRFKEELLANTMKAGFNAMDSGLSKVADTFARAMDNAIDQVGQYKSGIDARLQGTMSSYNWVALQLKAALAISPIVKQTEVLKKLNDAVDKGIAYNVEQRAFLATMTDKIVSTFDAFDENLTRLIRLQQADTTAARMGMEAQLLQFFNSTFHDSSYLNNVYDAVSQSLIEANSNMSRDMSISFEYNVQKWMGSLSSLGFSDDTIKTIAEGIGYLGSGNVQALAGNTQLQSLLAMAASRAGLSYSEMLIEGIDDSEVNILLKTMVEYLAEIADDDNKVVKAAYGDVFNFTQSDLQAIRSIVMGNTMADIYNQEMSYAKATAETQKQLYATFLRVSMNEMIDNVFDNFLYTAGETLASNPITALMWKTISLIEGVGGGIDLPFVNVMGFGLDLNMSVESLIKTGMFGLSALAQVPLMITSLASGGGMNLGIWGGTEYNTRGGAFLSNDSGITDGTSGTGAAVSASSSDTKSQAMNETKEDQESQKKTSKESMKDEITLETLYKEIFEKNTYIHTVDIPVKDKIGEVVAVNTATKSRIDDIYKLMTSPTDNLKVKVSNFNELSFLSPKDEMKMDGKTVTDLATAIAKALAGSSTSNLDGDGYYTISDIVRILSEGIIGVRDVQVAGELKDLNRNLI